MNASDLAGHGRGPQRSLSDEDRAQHEWQLDVPDFGEDGQLALRNATVLISRIGGLGGPVAWELAAAGVGRLILVHEGCPSPSDLNRQTLIRADQLGRPRVEQAVDRLGEFKPSVEIIPVNETMHEGNADRWIQEADLVVDCAPMFEERLAMNDAIVAQGKPMVECAMYELQASLTTIVPGRSPCLRCLVPSPPPAWKRRFPVFGAVSGAVGCLAAMEAIKWLSGLGDCLLGRMVQMDLRTMQWSEVKVHKNPSCPVCRTKHEG